MIEAVSRALEKKILPNGNVLTTYSRNGIDVCSAIIKKPNGRQIIRFNDFDEVDKVINVVNNKRESLIPTKEEAEALKAMIGIS